MPTQILMTRVETYRKYRDWLKEARDAEFKRESPVKIRRPGGFFLHGIVTFDENCALDQLAVRLENGNVWWYPLEDCLTVRRDDCPPWLQRILKKDSTVSVRRLTRHLADQGK